MNIAQRKRVYALLAAIFLLGLAIRLFVYPSSLYFGPEQARYFQYLQTAAWEHVDGLQASWPTWIDPSRIAHRFLPSVLHAQLLWLLIHHGWSVPTLVKLWSTVDAVSILVVCWAFSEYGLSVGLLASFFYSIGQYPIFVARWPYGFALIPFLFLLSLGSLVRVLAGRRKYIVGVMMPSILLMLLHPVGYIWMGLVIVILGVLSLVWRSKKFTYIYIASLLALVGIVAHMQKGALWNLLVYGDFIRHIYSPFQALGVGVWDTIHFMLTMFLGAPMGRYVWTWWIWIVGVFVLCAGIYWRLGRLFFDKETLLAKYVLSSLMLAAFFLGLLHWYYGSFMNEVQPAYIVPYIFILLPVSLCFVVLGRVKRLHIAIVAMLSFISILILGSTLYVLGGQRGDLFYSEIVEGMRVISADTSARDIVVCLYRDDTHMEDFLYVLDHMSIPRRIHLKMCVSPSESRVYDMVVHHAYDVSGTPLFIGNTITVLRK